MFKILLGTWALAGCLTGGLLTAVAQNPPAPPEEDNTTQTESESGTAEADAEEDVS
mgnify:CR=1 FL=1